MIDIFFCTASCNRLHLVVKKGAADTQFFADELLVKFRIADMFCNDSIKLQYE